MTSYNLAKNLKLPPADLIQDPGPRNDLLMAAAAAAAASSTDLNAAEKRVRFGSDSSDEITIHVREFELEATDNDQLENQEMHRSRSSTTSLTEDGHVVQAVVEATSGITGGLSPVGDQSAPSSTSTAASMSNTRYSPVLGAGEVGSSNRESHSGHYMQQPRRHNVRYYSGGSGNVEGSSCSISWHQGGHEEASPEAHFSAIREDFELPVEQYRWNEDFNQQNVMYTGSSQSPPPPPPPRVRRPVYEHRSASAFHRKGGGGGGGQRRLSDVDELDSHSAPLGHPQPDGSNSVVLYKKPPPARAPYRAVTSSEEFWRDEPLPQGVPLVLGPNGQWKYYTAPSDQRNVVYDSQRGGWVSRSLNDCDCTSEQLCPQHRRRQMASSMPQPDWSDDDYEAGDFVPFKVANARGDVMNPVPAGRRMYHQQQQPQQQHDGYSEPHSTKPTTQSRRYEHSAGGWVGENSPHFRY